METDSSNQRTRKRSQCSSCHGFDHTKRNCPNSQVSFTPLPTPRESNRLQPESKMDSDDESAIPDLLPDIDEDENDVDEVEFLWTRWSTVDVAREMPVQLDNAEQRMFDDDGIPIFKKTLNDVGPRLGYLAENGVNKGSGVLSYFMLFWTVFVFETFVAATNAFGRRYYSSAWKNVTVAEFKAFIAICLALGYVKYTNREGLYLFVVL